MNITALVSDDLWEAIEPFLPRLGVRYERRADLLQGLLHLACALICLRFLDPNWSGDERGRRGPANPRQHCGSAPSV